MPITVDLVCVLVFAVIGRASHGLDPVGVLSTAWPFLTACLVGWAAVILSGVPCRGWREGLIVWLMTLLGGMVLRVTSGDTAAAAFVAVAALFLGAAFFGWRLVYRLARHHRASAA
ncbi:DUF3054 domain-containing protein [Tessaracoccus lubricantis]|uniref:DUF3054 domain-containing protein n=1 Tax=Tessaracoccus lubricantis TaxID=545543 RepID=A0ABP9FNB3_9ACTN